MKILANDGMENSCREQLETAGFEVDTNKISATELPTAIKNYDALTVRSATKVTREILDAASRLKLIVRGGVGMDNIDVKYAEAKGIRVRNTPASSSESVAELVFAHLFSLTRNLHLSHRTMPADGNSNFNELKKSYSSGIELRGKTLGIIGLGNIGAAVARIAFGLGMKVKATDPFTKQKTIHLDLPGGQSVAIPVMTVDFNEVISTSDFITIHTAGALQIISAQDFARMKPGVMLINCARGGVVNEKDLLAALNSGKLAAAGLDVFENEPSPSKEILSHPRVSLSPHIGGSTLEAQQRIGGELAQIVIEFFSRK